MRDAASMSALCLLGSILLGGAQPPAYEKPSALVAFERARASIRRADVSWSSMKVWNRLRDEKFYRRSRYANGDVAYQDFGTIEGLNTFVGEEEVPTSRLIHDLYTPESRWQYEQGTVMAMAFFKEGRFSQLFDVRSIGMTPTRYDASSVSGALWDYPRGDSSARRYVQRVVDDLYEVEMFLDGGRSVRWYIDPERGWNAVRSQYLYEGDVTHEAVCSLSRYGDTWFPEWVAYFDSQHDGPISTVEVEAARLDEPDLPERLNASHIGVEPGMWAGIVGLPGHEDGGWWTGDRLVSTEEYDELKAQGKISKGPTLLADAAEQRARSEQEARRRQSGRPVQREGLSGAPRSAQSETANATDRPGGALAASFGKSSRPRVESEWERYTREFIIRYALDAEQSQKAISILKQCQQRGHRHIERYERVLRQTEEALRELKDGRRQSELRRRLAEIRKPIDDIFEQQFKPRLERLPTRAQRQAAGEAQEQRGADKEGEENKEKP